MPSEWGADDFERRPPQDIDAEQSVLGGMLLSRTAVTDVLEILGAEHFYKPAHQIVFRSITDLYARGEPADPITVTAGLTKRGEINKIGGASYLHALVQAVPTAANAQHYAEIVLETARLRAVIDAGTRIAARAYARDADIRTVLDRAAGELLALTASFDLGQDPDGWDTPMEKSLADWEDGQAAGTPPALPMPYAELSRTLGLEPGHFAVFAGRPGMGKSVVLLDIVRHLALTHGRRAAFVSLEMTRRQVLNRLVSAEASIDVNAVRRHELDAAAWRRYDTQRARITGGPLSIAVPKGGITVAQLRSHLRTWSIEERLPEIVAVDYAQIVKPARTNGYSNRTTEVDAIARGLKELALEFGVGLVAAAQLSRQTTARDSKLPQLSDLRESGEIEQAADAVVLLHREDYYEPYSARTGELDLIVAKNRNGSTRTCTVAWQGRFSRACDFEVP